MIINEEKYIQRYILNSKLNIINPCCAWIFYVVAARLYVITDTNGTILISFYIYDYKQFRFTFYNILNIFINNFFILNLKKEKSLLQKY